MQTDALYYGDCLDWMGQWDDRTVDLIYLDPPFNSNAEYNVLYGEAAGDAQFRAFADTWTWDADAAERCAAFERAIARPAHRAITGLWPMLGNSGMMAYLSYMAERLEQCHRLLKPTGSLYLHCDPTASHALKLVLDSIFGAENFRNEIVWKRRTGTLTTTKQHTKFGAVTDTILFYVRSGAALFARQYSLSDPQYQRYVDKTFRYRDKRGRHYRVDNLASPSPRPNLTYTYRGYEPPANGWAISREKMEQ